MVSIHAVESREATSASPLSLAKLGCIPPPPNSSSKKLSTFVASSSFRMAKTNVGKSVHLIGEHFDHSVLDAFVFIQQATFRTSASSGLAPGISSRPANTAMTASVRFTDR